MDHSSSAAPLIWKEVQVHFSHFFVKAYIDEETGEAERGKLVVGDEGISVDSLR